MENHGMDWIKVHIAVVKIKHLFSFRDNIDDRIDDWYNAEIFW